MLICVAYLLYGVFVYVSPIESFLFSIGWKFYVLSAFRPSKDNLRYPSLSKELAILRGRLSVRPLHMSKKPLLCLTFAR